MPQLPSGRHVGLSMERALGLAREGNLALSLDYATNVKSPNDLAPLIDIVYYEPIEGEPPPGAPRLSGLTLSALETEQCDWSDEDRQAMRDLITGDRARDWLRAQYDELSELIRTVKAPIPENLRGIFEADD